jgi:hypothetical protein
MNASLTSNDAPQGWAVEDKPKFAQEEYRVVTRMKARGWHYFPRDFWNVWHETLGVTHHKVKNGNGRRTALTPKRCCAW